MATARPESVLTPIQREALSLFGRIEGSSAFYLSGAAALAGFYLGHRRSGDLDLFSPDEPMIATVGLALERESAPAGFECQIVRRYRTFLELVLRHGSEAARIQLAQDSPHRLEPTTTTYLGVRVDSLRDLAANKLLAAFGRAEPRDLIDVYVLVRDGFCTFDELLRWAREKDSGLDAYYLAQALRSVEELPDQLERLPVEMLVPLEVTGMKRFLLDRARGLLERGLPG